MSWIKIVIHLYQKKKIIIKFEKLLRTFPKRQKKNNNKKTKNNNKRLSYSKHNSLYETSYLSGYQNLKGVQWKFERGAVKVLGRKQYSVIFNFYIEIKVKNYSEAYFDIRAKFVQHKMQSNNITEMKLYL